MLLMKLGYRNLWRNRRRTLLTMTAMSFATALVILMLGIYDGMLWSMLDGATEMYYGHVKITAPGYLEKFRIYMTIDEDSFPNTVKKDKQVKGIAGRVRGFALLSFGKGEASHTQPAELFGINPDEERNVTKLESCVLEGSFLSGSDTKEILLGKGLAGRLEAEIGGEIVAMGQSADGSIAAELFRVVGIIETGDQIRDASLAVVGRKTLQEMMALEGKLHEWAVAMKRPLDALKWTPELKTGSTDFEITPWNQFLPLMGEMLETWKVFKFIFAFIFYFAVILITVNTMYMAFFERLREFGIMEAVGMRIRRLSVMIVLEGFLMSGISSLIGGGVGILASLYFNRHSIDLSAFFTEISFAGASFQPIIKCYLQLDNMLIPIMMVTVLGMLVAVFPARKLMRLRPVDALKEV